MTVGKLLLKMASDMATKKFKKPKKQRDWPDVPLTGRREGLTETFLKDHGYSYSDTQGKPNTYTYVGDKLKAYSATVHSPTGKHGVSVKTFNNPTLRSLRNWMGY